MTISMPPEETDSINSKREVVKLRARANLLFALLSQSDQDLAWQRKEVQRRDGDLDQLRTELQRRDDDLGRLRAELQRRDGDLGQLRAELQRRDGDLGQMRVELQSIVNSRSWRVTKPLRALIRLTRK
jgi:septal ring factor EnvC (AmiA/AmiB activator)